MKPTQVVVLPPAGREAQIERWGIVPDRTGGRVRGAQAEDAEPHGYDDGHAVEGHEGQTLGFLQDGGWHAVEPIKGGTRGEGTTSHRGVLHPDEHVDPDVLLEAVEAELGFTHADVHAVYRQGRKSAAQLELRGRIDARLYEISRAGGNLTELGRALGFPVHEGSTPWAIKQAVARARSLKEAA